MLTIAHDYLNRRVHIDETASSLEYFCPVCGAPLVTKKGEVRRHHFAHRPSHHCSDTWQGTYTDSEWHFGWQERYPRENRERTLELDQVRHRADIIVGRTVVEFQRSQLSPQSFNERNDFYGSLGYKVLWVYDLRDLYESGVIRARDDDPLWFTWENPRQSFNAYDLTTGMADLFFQLREDDGDVCIVRVHSRLESGFEEFSIQEWMTARRFLEFTGMRNGSCPPPCLNPLETNEDYLRFKGRYSIVLDSQQERAVQVVDGACLLLAVPGSGKTTVMVDRLGYLTLERGIPPECIVALTYGRAAANEMRERFAQQFGDEQLANRIKFCTINSLANGIYKEWCGKSPKRRYRKPLKDSELKQRLRKICREVIKEYVPESTVIEFATTISWAKNSLVDDELILAYASEDSTFREVYTKYSACLRDDARMDFDDQMRFAKFALEHDEHLIRKWRNRYSYWCVDEAQDTSALQHALIKLLSVGARGVFMVGDEDQCIYGYRGACPEEMLNFKFTYDNALVLKMENNYRSGKEIVNAASTFVGKCTGRFEKNMVSKRKDGSSVKVVDAPSRLEQYDAACQIIRSRGNGRTVAVIYRDNETGIPLVDRLLREGIPFQLLSKASTFFTSPVVRDIRAFMSLANDPYDTRSFRKIYKKARCDIAEFDVDHTCRNVRRGTRTVCEALFKQMSTFRKDQRKKEKGARNAREFRGLMEDIASLPPADAIDRIMWTGYGDSLDERNTHRIGLLKLIASHEESAASFLARLEDLDKALGDDSSHRKPRPVVLSTAHSSKGREFNGVVILDAVDGVFPSVQIDSFTRSKDAASDYQEERRLFYVAMTRARDELILIRPVGEQTPFIDEVKPRLVPESQVVTPCVHANDQRNRGGMKSDSGGERREYEKVTNRAALRRLPDTKVLPPTSSRYDVTTWNVIEQGYNWRYVSNGDMDAMVSNGFYGRCIDMVVDLEAGVLLETCDHLGELSYGYTEYNLCICVIKAQKVGSAMVTQDDWGTVVINVGGENSAEILRYISALLSFGVKLSMTYLEAWGSMTGRLVQSLLPDGRGIELSSERLNTY